MGRRGAQGLLIVALFGVLCVPLTASTSASAAPGWQAGATAISITPPAYNAADDARDFPLCDTSIYNGRRLFDFEEPYIDRAGTGFFDYTQDPFCDNNHNGRWDGLYSSGGVNHLTEWVHDPIWARALAISDGSSTVVIESITSQGLLIEDDLRIRAKVKAARPQVAQVFISSTHNESSPDPIGIYGAPDNGTGVAGVFSGVDDYYMTFLVAQSALAAERAVDGMAPARVRVGEFYPPDVRARLSETFLTTDAIQGGSPPFGTPETTDRRGRVVQLVRADTGANIETLFNWAAHNQQVGHANDQSVAPDPSDRNRLKRVNRSVSDDWPGVFANALEARLGGHAMFLVGDNGSIEDPHAYPLPVPDNECPAAGFTDHRPREEGCFPLAAQTGTRLAADVAARLAGSMDDVAPHALTAHTDQFNVPLQNQLFLAAFGAGLFAHRTAATVQPCLDSNHVVSTCFLTEVGRLDFGPQLEMLVNPGEAYPALIEGHPFGIEQMSCPGRAAPPVPAWHAHADHKLEMGLGDDMIGYEVPAPGWFADPAIHVDPTCPAGARAQSDPTADYDQHDQYHKLESESVGPDAGELVPQHLAALADPSASASSAIQAGRFLMPSGSLTRRGADGPVGMWVLPARTSAFVPGTGTVVALAGIRSFGSLPVTAHGVFMDFDGLPQAGPDIDTRGMLVTSAGGTITRYFMDPYPQLSGTALGAAEYGMAEPSVATPAGLPNTSRGPGGGPAGLVLFIGTAAIAAGLMHRRRASRKRCGLLPWATAARFMQLNIAPNPRPVVRRTGGGPDC